MHHSFCIGRLIHDTIYLNRGYDMLKVILCDMDGTLIDSDDLVIKIYQRLTQTYIPKVSFESLDLGDVFQSSYTEVLAKLYGEVNEEHLKFIHTTHQALKHHDLKLFDGVDDLLKSLKKQGNKLGLLTSELRSIALDELNILGIDHYFDHILAFDDLEKPKPYPNGLFAHMTYFNVKANEMIYIGDQKSDGIAAQKAGVYSVLMDWSKTKSIDYQKQFNHVAHDANELMSMISFQSKACIQLPQNRYLRIMQFTDFHLMNDEKDTFTYKLISDLINQENPDFIVLTGDQTMSKDAPMLYEQLGSFMDHFKIPYTYVFGNHDTEHGITYESLIKAISKSKYLIFDQGPQYLGYGNHVIKIVDQSFQMKGSLVMLDTHIDNMYMIDNQLTWGYGSITDHQILWYENIMKLYPSPHLAFFHIPIPEIKEIKNSNVQYTGDFNEEPCTPPVNTNFFEVAKRHNVKAMFFGHDHLNDISYIKDKINLCYGRVSGHYEYGIPGFPKGARMITFDQEGHVKTYVVIHQK